MTDLASLFRPDLPAAADIGAPSQPFAFVGGNNDPESVPFAGLAEAAMTVMTREGRNLATYNLGGSALGYEPLRTFVSRSLKDRAFTDCETDEILVTSGSLQGLDLVNDALLKPGDTVIVEEATYGGMLSRLQRLGVNYHGVKVDRDGIDTDHLAQLLEQLASDGAVPRYIYTIPTVQNPTGTVMSLERRRALLDLAHKFGTAVFEDDCYADLLWGTERPPTLRQLDKADTSRGNVVVYCGSFSKSIAPALRIGYLVADPPVIAQLLGLKTDAGTGALEQMVVAEFATTHFDEHVDQLSSTLEARCNHMVEAVTREFGSSVTVDPPMGGIYVWLTFPEGVDTGAMVAGAAEVGVEFNPGAGWSADPGWGSRRLRLCFGNQSPENIDTGVAALANVARATTSLI